ncbi:Putative translation initiation inhibitor, yjgF family (Endoribonuclease L-PSP/chorismate mutase-like) [Vibrio nigripulchritudo SOn1]|uniref:Translation initiation inhibitor, yjgF family (Endoribonuclease L-PSP/chorismate mutase-like) n=1 Tax=Vibrio nigripulchritudo SOn1 TaxID=1238450 RepID=A0AAV2VXQ7_9VIBR|nr:Rid family detoxifying hydrolase [Vibrio nigripulchritudo]CCO49543.1 Putative translation initiation inhibitor, yjgF family (Endoribonuclease L-PSP/chorismate mutase-like) [Vibrio nigripulchritudo SOn1]
MKKVISSNHAPEAIGPYSHGTVFKDLIFTSGQLPVSRETGCVVLGGIAEQSAKSLENLKSIIEAGGGNINTVLKTTCYLANIEDFSAFNSVYTRFFKTDCPARSCFSVKDLPLGVLIEIEAIAYKA